MKWLQILGVVIITTVFSYEAFADSKSTNEMIKDCLNVYQYDYNAPVEERLNTFNWRGASNCVGAFHAKLHEERLAERREFLKKKPWYKGKNWKWEERAEYTCERIYSNQVGANITLCHKPYYLN